MQSVESVSRTLRFSVFEADLRAAELRKHGVRIKLQDQPFRILSRLLERPGDIVTREELRQELWHDHTFVDFDRSLNKAMAKLRSALGDSAETPRYIETIPRHGYRLIVPVTLNQTPDAHAPVHSRSSLAPGMGDEIEDLFAESVPFTGGVGSASLEKPARLFYSFTDGWSFSFLMAVIVTLVVLAGVMSFRLKQSEIFYGRPASVNARQSVAVLGFRNLSGNPQDNWLSTAFSDWLATELSVGDQIRTVPSENIARMKLELALPELDSLGRDSLAKIQKDLGSDLVVAGSYAMLGKESAERVRLDVRLLDTRTGETFFATSETGTDENLFSLVSRVGEDLRGRLGVRKVTQAEAVEVALVLPSNPEAARFYAEGLSNLRILNARDAQVSLTRAVVAEPNFALAHSALATAWVQLGYDQNAAREARKAFDLSSKLSRAERLLIEGRYREASHEEEKAITIYDALFQFFPDNPDYGLQLAAAQIKAARWREALETIETLRALPAPLRNDPRIDMAEGDAARSLGDMKRAERAMVSAAEKARASGALLLLAKARLAQAWLYDNLGQSNEEEAAVKESKELYQAAHDRKGVSTADTIRAIALEESGDYEAARRGYQESLAILRETGDEAAVANETDNLGDIYLYLGDLSVATKSYSDALATYQKIKDDDGVALAKLGLGDVALARGDHVQSKQFYEEALDICRRIGDRGRQGAALYDRGQALRLGGDLSAAWQDESAAASILKEVGDRVPLAQVTLRQARLLLDQNKIEAAATAVREASELLAHTNARREQAFADVLLAQTALAKGHFDEAAEAVNRARLFVQRSHDKELDYATRLESARIEAAAGGSAKKATAGAELRALARAAARDGYKYVSFEARLSDSLLPLDGPTNKADRVKLIDLRNEALNAGFTLIANRAALELRN